jgi:hypothetical protein
MSKFYSDFEDAAIALLTAIKDASHGVLASLQCIEHQIKKLERKIDTSSMAITAAQLGAFLDAGTALINAKIADDVTIAADNKAIADFQAQVAVLQQNAADLNDPALLQKLNDFQAAAAAATVDPNAPVATVPDIPPTDGSNVGIAGSGNPNA